MSHIFIDRKKVGLVNNCPKCYSKDGLHLTFKQKIIDTKFYKTITAEINHEISCETCNSRIYPEQWTDDIERVFEYQKRAFVPKKNATYLKKGAWMLLGTIILLSVLLTVFLFYTSL